MMRKILLLLYAAALSLPAQSYQYYEREYQNVWCAANKGVTEVRLPDAARADCVTEKYAVEVDFASKWAESIGQSLYYAAVLKKQPGVLLIMEDLQKDGKYLNRLKTVAEMYNITIWTITPEDVCN